LDERELLRAVYQSIEWERLYGLAPDASREDVDELFRRLREAMDRAGMVGPPNAPDASDAPGVPPYQSVIVYCDGASSGNPGPAGIGVVVTAPDGTELRSWGAPVGRATNNVAEYQALLAALRSALEVEARRVEVRSDSELLVRQINGEYRVKNPALKELHEEATELLGRFEKWEARHVSREQNAKADKIAKAAVKEAKKRP